MAVMEVSSLFVDLSMRRGSLVEAVKGEGSRLPDNQKEQEIQFVAVDRPRPGIVDQRQHHLLESVAQMCCPSSDLSFRHGQSTTD